MGRIKKVATERHTVTLSPFVRDFVQRAVVTPLHHLPAHLNSFPQHWPLPRGDLYHWIPVLDRFDHIIEIFNKEYGLSEGPQTQPFARTLLELGDYVEGCDYPQGGADTQELESNGVSAEGDRELIEAILHFSRILLEHCGNRSLYASSSHINDLLHTTSLSLLRLCLKLSLRLAQRYQVARFKNGIHLRRHLFSPTITISILTICTRYRFPSQNLLESYPASHRRRAKAKTRL
jgi:E3 ubiquitin-protein ligase HUWE1